MQLVSANGTSGTKVKELIKNGVPDGVYDAFLRARFKFLQVTTGELKGLKPLWGWAWNVQGRFRHVQGRKKTPEVPDQAFQVIYITERFNPDPRLDVVPGIVAHSLLGCVDPVFIRGQCAETDNQALRDIIEDIKHMALASRMEWEKGSVASKSDYSFKKYREMVEAGVTVELWPEFLECPAIPANERRMSSPFFADYIVKKAQDGGIVPRTLRKSTLGEIKAYILQSLDTSTRINEIPRALESAQIDCEQQADFLLGTLHTISPNELQRWLTGFISGVGFIAPPGSSNPATAMTIAQQLETPYARIQFEQLSKTLVMLVKDGIRLGEQHTHLMQLRNSEFIAKLDNGSKFTSKGSKRQGTLDIQAAIDNWRGIHQTEPAPRDLLVAKHFRIRVVGSDDLPGFHCDASMQTKVLNDMEVYVVDSPEAPNDGWIKFRLFAKRVQRLTRVKRGRRRK